MQPIDTSSIIRKTAKKIYKTGFFRIKEINKNYLSYLDSHGNMYVLQQGDEIGLYFRIGYVTNWEELKPTFESEYQSLGMVQCSRFIDKIEIQHTDNPDYILRLSKSYLDIN